MDHRRNSCSDHRMVSLRRGIKNCKSNIYISASYGGCIYSDLCDRYDHQPCISASCIFKDHQRSIWFQSNFWCICRISYDAGNQKRSVLQWSRYWISTKCFCIRTSKSSNQTGLSTDVIRIHWYPAFMHSNSHDVFVIRNRPCARITGGTMGTGSTAWILRKLRTTLYHSSDGIVCIYNTSWELFLLW